jgi:hypothetical protein
VKFVIYSQSVLRSKNLRSIHPLPSYVFMAQDLVKHRDNFTFYLFTLTIYKVWRETKQTTDDDSVGKWRPDVLDVIQITRKIS